jgi:unsaturated chondroitin disaccharide hydrolase
MRQNRHNPGDQVRIERSTYFLSVEAAATEAKRDTRRHQQALDRCVAKLRATMPVIGLRNPKVGLPDYSWAYCGPFDWVLSFWAGQLWLALQLTGESVFLNAARARRARLRGILAHQHAQDHDLGFQFSLSCVAEWLMTGEREAHEMALQAAGQLLGRYRPEGRYLQAWNPSGGKRAEFVNGRMIADTMQNLALLYWAHREAGRADFAEAADAHAETTLKHIVRPDDTSFHTFLFDVSSGKPLHGETRQGYTNTSCWSRGQAWLIHGFAQSALTTGNGAYADAAKRLAAKAEELMGDDAVPPWDYTAPDPRNTHRDSSAAAIMAAGVYILAGLCETGEAARWRCFGDRLIAGLLDHCDLTENPQALGLLAHGAAHVTAGFTDTMLPYGDYYFMEALMRSLGHDQFFW